MRRIAQLSLATAVVMLLATAGVLAAPGGKPFITVLSGAAEVPGPGDPDGSGVAFLVLNPGMGEVCWAIAVTGITLPAIGAHIHAAPEGVAGPIVVPLSPPDMTGLSRGCTDGVARDLILAIIESPEQYYVNVHTTDFPAGALRGQLSR